MGEIYNKKMSPETVALFLLDLKNYSEEEFSHHKKFPGDQP